MRSGSVIDGYFAGPEATRRAVHDGWLHTGDAGYLEPDGHLVVLGRVSEVVRTGRPAVHWYTFSELCNLGRLAGFTQFYSPIDLYREDDPPIRKSGLRRFCLRQLQSSPWLRALALIVTFFGGMIMMLKGRPAEQSG